MNAVTAEAVRCEGEGDVDAIDEIRLRTWARRNYTPIKDRDFDWHPIVLDEMRRVDEGL